MTLVKWKDLNSLDRVFRNWFEDGLETLKTQAPAFGLADVYYEDNSIVAEFDLPGIDPKEIDVTIEKGYLRVSGERKAEKEINDKNYYCKEIKKGNFERYIQLPTETVDKEKVSASYKNGVLKITAPVKEIEKKKIEIVTE